MKAVQDVTFIFIKYLPKRKERVVSGKLKQEILWARPNLAVLQVSPGHFRIRHDTIGPRDNVSNVQRYLRSRF